MFLPCPSRLCCKPLLLAGAVALAFVVALLCALRSSHGNVGELFGALLVNGFICALLPYAIAGYRKTRSQHIYQWQLFTTVVVGSIIVIGTSFFST